jgi:isopentenyl-diphosphate delta-isomerase
LRIPELSGQHRIVSSEGEELILVDVGDNEIGYGSKADCHDGNGILHRAFSLFLFDDDGALLLQQRSAGKRLWPGYWSNSCCSHPRRGETLQIATMRRLDDELNIAAYIEHAYYFCYQATFSEAGSENELCHVFLGRVEGKLRPNESEIQATRFISVGDLDDELVENPQHFTPWLKQEWQTLKNDYVELLSRYAINL